MAGILLAIGVGSITLLLGPLFAVTLAGWLRRRNEDSLEGRVLAFSLPPLALDLGRRDLLRHPLRSARR